MVTSLHFACLLIPLLAMTGSLDYYDWEALLDATQVVPPTGSAGSAQIRLMYDVDEFTDPRYCDYWIACEELSGSPTGASLRWGRPGENGPVAFDLVSGTIQCPFEGGAYIPWSVVGRLEHVVDTLYVVISTTTYPEGEVRGAFVNITPPAAAGVTWGRVRSLYR